MKAARPFKQKITDVKHQVASIPKRLEAKLRHDPR